MPRRLPSIRFKLQNTNKIRFSSLFFFFFLQVREVGIRIEKYNIKKFAYTAAAKKCLKESKSIGQSSHGDDNITQINHVKHNAIKHYIELDLCVIQR